MLETIISKQCSQCKRIKPVSEFFKKTTNKDEHRSWCKICTTISNKIFAQSEKGRAISRKSVKKYHQTKKGKETMKRAAAKYQKTEKGQRTALKAKRKYEHSEKGKAYHKQWSLKHPESRKARNVVEWAVRKGTLPRPDSLPCHYCPNPAKEYHHWKGYAPENRLDVVAVCKKCHYEHPYYPALSKPAGSKKGIMA